MEKYTPEEKLQIVLRYLEGKECSHCYDNSVMENFIDIMNSKFL